MRELEVRRHDDPDELIRHRFLCRGAGALLCAPTGVGKSTFSMQLALRWAAGQAAFGFEPSRPLRSLIVQAENDEGDLAEMRDGVLRGESFSPAQIDEAVARVSFSTVDDVCGEEFLRVLRPLLGEAQPDVLWIDPLLSFIGGDVSRQEVVSPFLRNGLNPLLHRHQCAGIIVHHTNKPPSGSEKPSWQAGDFAYTGSGSADLANWARAGIAIRSVGSHDVFELRAAKRGARLGWTDASGARQFVRAIAHSPDGICWREATLDTLPQPGRPKGSGQDPSELLKLLPSAGLTTSQWQELAHTELGLSRSSFHRLRARLDKEGRASRSSTSGHWQPVRNR